MYKHERLEQILEYINKHGKATTEELSLLCDTSKVTIRSDINELAVQGLIVKTHGGALSVGDRLNYEIPYNSKSVMNRAAKEKIGAVAATMIHDDDVIIIDSGSTTFEVINHLTAKNVTVVTNDIRIGYKAAHMGNVNLMVTGGELERSVYTLHGDDTEAYFNKIKVNKVFLGCDAIDLEFGISNTIMREVAVKRQMISSADQIIVVMDSSKFNKRVFVKVCDLDCIDILITESIDPHTKEILEKKGVFVVVAE